MPSEPNYQSPYDAFIERPSVMTGRCRTALSASILHAGQVHTENHRLALMDRAELMLPEGDFGPPVFARDAVSG